ncbi:ABC transporter substrate-binding protein, partial [Bacillus thuringiensis]|nr:ABC transporter substrate-binding protein [Bacillus thuringiensis]
SREMTNTMEGLYSLGKDDKLVPGVAKEFKKSEDGKKYTFKLREDAKWSNGEPVTAKDFVYAWQRAINPDTAAKSAYIMYDIKNAEKINKKEMSPDQLGVKAIDDYILEVELDNSIPYLVDLMVYPIFYPVNEKFVKEQGTKFGLEANTTLYNGPFTLNLIVGLVISAGFLLFSKHMMLAMNLQGDVLTYAQNYLSIVGGAIFLQAIINSLAAIIRVHGFTKQAMFISLGMNMIHIVGNYVLIFGKFGFPELGVQGAAISSAISRLIALIVFFWLLYRVMEYRVKLQYYFTLSKEYIGKILKIGIPSAFEQVMYQACQIVFLYYATYLGTESLAARQYATNISMFTYLFAIAIGMGTAIIIGRLVGGGEKDEAYERLWKSVKWAIGVTLCMVA